MGRTVQPAFKRTGEKGERKQVRCYDTHKERKEELRKLAAADKGVISAYAGNTHKMLDRSNLKNKKEINAYGVEVNAKGRNAVYDSLRFPHIAETLCREYGFITIQLAEVFGVSDKAIELWSAKYPEFRAALRRGREDFDSEKVEKSLLKRALGYEFVEKTERMVYLIGKNKLTDVEVSVPAREIVTMHKQMAPDVKAIMFWLQNRNSDRWKSVAYIQAQVNAQKTITTVNVDADIQNMSVDQIKALRDIVAASKSDGKEQEAIEVGNEELGDIVYRAGQKMLGHDVEEYDLEENN